MMRVAIVSEHASPVAPVGHPETGGQNVYVDALARHLGRAGCEVDVYTRRDDADAADRLALDEAVTVHHVAAGPAGPVPRDELMPHMPAFAEGLARAWRTRPPDVVHAHFWMSGWASSLAIDEATPLVQTFHALGAVKRRHQADADTSPPERDSIERRLARTADVVVATCSDEVRELRRLGGGGEGTVVVPCGVGDPFSPFGPVDPHPRRQRHRLVCVSRLVPRKGIADVVRAVGRLHRVDPHLDTELVIVGGAVLDDQATDPDVVALRDVAASEGVAERVTFRGRLAGDDVAAVMRSADIVVCAPWYEPFGIVPLEAMACGVPVVGTAVGGLLDTVVDGVTGLLVPPRRPDRLAEALAGLLADPARRRRLGAAGAGRATAYRWPQVADAVLRAYGQAIDRRAGAALATEALA